MVELRSVIIVTVLMALVFTASGDSSEEHGHHHRPPSPPPPPVVETTPAPTTESVTTSTSVDTTSSDASPLERAHWCRTRNGTYIPLGYSYMQSVCTMCQCTKTRAIRCSMLQCMPTYCVDDSKPVRREGQCCTQCEYFVAAGNTSSCEYNGVTYLHGAVIRSVENKMSCWCQMGNIECRAYSVGLMQSLDMLNDTTIIYIIVMVIFVVLMVGALLCCSCTAFYYYYYQRYQQAIQQAYDEYVVSAGWEPIEEEQTDADKSAEEKRIEAETYNGTSYITESVPPSYADVHKSYSSQEQSQQ